MELILGLTGALRPGPYVDCPEEGSLYVLEDNFLTRYPRAASGMIGAKPVLVIDDDEMVPPHERPRLRRIARMLAETKSTARLASPYVVFVPRGGSATGIHARSGIVGAPLPGEDRVHVYFEGAVHGQQGLARLADRVSLACGGLVEHAPTVAHMVLPITSLIEVGTFDPASGTVATVDAKADALLAAWLGSGVLDPAELRCGGAAP